MNRQENIYEEMNDSQLFLRISHGDKAAFAYVYAQFAPVVFVFCERYLRNSQDAEDSVQHIFLRLWEKRGEIVIRDSLKDYIYMVAKNHVLNKIRDRLSAELRQQSIARQRPVSEISVEDEYLKVETARHLETATLALPPVKQRIVSLRRQGMTNKEIANTLQMPENTVKTYYAQSVRFYREYFRKTLLFVISFFTCLVS